MISPNFFYKSLYENFCRPLGVDFLVYDVINQFPYPTSVNHDKIKLLSGCGTLDIGACICQFEEPLSATIFTDLSLWLLNGKYILNLSDKFAPYWNNSFNLFCNSEISRQKQDFLKENNFVDWYFFYHGFLALYWYNDYKFLPFDSSKKITKLFISYNNLLKSNRSYRLTLLAHIIKNNLDNNGLISCPYLNYDICIEEVLDKNTKLSINSKKLIISTFKNYSEELVLDIKKPNGSESAAINFDLNNQALFHLVNETIFYDESLHLTEKIFKPIVSLQPFLLVSTPGSLQYLKRYGFKTFDKWIDESYDNIRDPDLRIIAIVNELKKYQHLSVNELNSLHTEMLPILLYNRNHFFTRFKEIIVDELIYNFSKSVSLYNYDLSERFRINSVNTHEIKDRFMM